MRVALTLALAFAPVVAGCSAIVSLSDDDIRCVGSGATDPCPDGRQCRDGFCVLMATPDTGPPDTGDGGCTPDPRGELCGGEDEDCDGMLDEGHDQDGDGFTWCGDGERNQQDCDDNDPNTHPGNAVVVPGIEVCDGADNNCNGMIDEDDGTGALCSAGLACIDRICADPTDCSLEAVTCPMGQSCDFDAMPPRCVPGGCMPGSCTAPAICNTESGECVTPGAIGDPCDTDTDCDGTAICVRREAAGLTTGGRFCTEPCCADDECSAGNVCWVSGTGVKLCIPPSQVGTSQGTGIAGARCTSGSECISGVCIDGERCLGNCGNDGDCDPTRACTATVTGTSSVQFSCDPPGGPIAQGDVDFDAEGCSSKFFSGFACSLTECGRICIGSCRTTADCPDMIDDTDYFCGFVGASGYTSTFAACTEVRHMGAGRTGASCTDNRGCRDLTCLSDRCADTCCTDADCGAGGGKCRPVQIRGQWETHCI